MGSLERCGIMSEKRQSGRERRKEFAKNTQEEIRKNPTSFKVYTVMRILVILILIRQFFLHNYQGMALCILTLVLLVLPAALQVRLRVNIPQPLEIILYCFIFAAEILGELSSFYTAFPWWDTMLHTTNGFLAAAVGFSLVLLLNNDDKLMFSCSPFFVALVAFCFSMTIGVVWEFFECFCDLMWGLDMQKDTIVHTISSVTINPDGLQEPVAINNIHQTIVDGQMLPIDGYLDIGILDTMEDLFVNFIGALTFSTIGFFALRNSEKKSGVVEGLMIRKK